MRSAYDLPWKRVWNLGLRGEYACAWWCWGAFIADGVMMRGCQRLFVGKRSELWMATSHVQLLSKCRNSYLLRLSFS